MSVDKKPYTLDTLDDDRRLERPHWSNNRHTPSPTHS